MKNENGFPALLERFFTQRLIAQRRVSSHTIASYRDTFRLLLQFVEKRLHKPPFGLALTDLDTSLIGAFLDERLQNLAGVVHTDQDQPRPGAGKESARRDVGCSKLFCRGDRGKRHYLETGLSACLPPQSSWRRTLTPNYSDVHLRAILCGPARVRPRGAGPQPRTARDHRNGLLPLIRPSRCGSLGVGRTVS